MSPSACSCSGSPTSDPGAATTVLRRRTTSASRCRASTGTSSTSCGSSSSRPSTSSSSVPMEAVRFALPGPQRDRLVSAVLKGEKTATSSLLAEWLLDDEALPAAGERREVLDSDDNPVAVIETTAVDVIRLGDVDLTLAREEGEGFESVADWRRAHEGFWADEVMPRLPADLAGALNDDAQIVVIRFRLV